ncbi:MAG: methionine adenosyltransferase [Thermodesulfobacteriota bacterium]
MRKDFIFTSESVTEGHPDKLCDQISDAIVDQFLQQDPYARIIAECAVATAIVFIAARFYANASVDVSAVARNVINQIGYDQQGFNGRSCSIITNLKEKEFREGAHFDERTLSEKEMEHIPIKNQVTLFGFACNQTASMLPLPIWLAHKLARRLTSVRLQRTLSYLEPDGKTQVAVEFRQGKPYRIHSITLIASQTKGPQSGGPALQRLEDDLRELVIASVFKDETIVPDERTRIFVNPDGSFITGGPSIHSGLTGRKTAIDTYGEFARHSGAALSGKGPLRIDRIGAYAARYAAKNIVAAGLAEECEVQLSYSIGFPRPVSIQVETWGTGKIPEEKMGELLEQFFDFRLAGILKQFNLRYLPLILKGGFYRKLAAYGHMGRMDIGLPWELTDKAQALKAAIGF